MTEEKRHKGHFRIGRYQNRNADEECVFIEVHDSESNTCVLELHTNGKQFFDALFNRRADCAFQVFNVERIGMKYIHNRVKLKSTEYRPDVGSEAYLSLTEQLQPLLDEGWDFRNSDLENGHNYTRDGEGNYTVGVHTWKYVDPESEEAKEWEAAQAAKETARSGARKGKKG